jgi:quinol-cytochrome oxidoreductase complex cytochrome b subunit
MVTPPHIVPEWYLLPYYAILRAITFDIWFIPAKLIGVVAMFASILILLFLPWLDRSKVRSARFRPIYRQFFWILVVDCVILGYVGANPPEGYFIPLGQAATAYYFLHFLVLIPLISLFERPKAVPDSISAAVLKGP